MIRTSRFAEFANIIRRRTEITSDNDIRKTERKDKTIRVISSTPFFRGYLPERQSTSYADVRLLGKMVFFVDRKEVLHPVEETNKDIGDIIEYPVNKDGSFIEDTTRYVVSAVFRTGPKSHSEVFCDIEDNKQTVMTASS